MRYARGLLQEAAVLATPPVSAPSDAASQHTATSGGTTPKPTSSTSPFDVNSHFSPTMIIILVILLSAFSFMGFFAVYVRRCTSEESISQRGSSRRTPRPDELNRGCGVDPLLVESYPMVSYVVAKKKGCNECVVCLGDFEGGEELKQLPKCKHVFHPACIGLWLESHTTCPLCRRSLVNSDRWSVSFRWGGSSRGGSLSTRLSGEESSRSRRGGETASPWLRRAGSSTGWLFRRNEDASSRGGAQEVRVLDASSRGGAQEGTSVRVQVDASPSCELEPPSTSCLSSSQHGLAASPLPLSGLPGPLSSEVVPGGLGKQASLPREIEECAEGMARGHQVGQGRAVSSEVAASGLHASTGASEVATSEVAQSVLVESRKPRETAALQGRRRLSRSNSTGDSVRRRAGTGCMPFSLHRSRSEEEVMVGPACATSEHGPLSGSCRCASQSPHEPCQGATSASPATSAPFSPPR